ncbi:hypothetical protein ACJJIP_08455 [Microbulbifer sp. VTAC004]|uniref:hypothetical protein n=1 Tax=unclassified Microbulbifer TaxID=2619833 RepID=UPI00403A49E9
MGKIIKDVTFRNGEKATMFKHANGYWHCPVCGSPELGSPAYLEDGSGSFQICSCGFEFGFDDEPSASGAKIDSVIGNWEVKRHRKLQYLSSKSDQYKELLTNLRCIGIELNT